MKMLGRRIYCHVPRKKNLCEVSPGYVYESLGWSLVMTTIVTMYRQFVVSVEISVCVC